MLLDVFSSNDSLQFFVLIYFFKALCTSFRTRTQIKPTFPFHEGQHLDFLHKNINVF